jgi:hypothetical protein
MSALIDLVGKRFGRLTVRARGENDKQGKARWICECACGNRTLSSGNVLRSGHAQSCGCLQKELAARIHRTHGMHGTATYRSYQSAKARCKNPNDPSYDTYGKRGIKFLYTSFEQFFEDMGVRPDGLTIERRNNEGHYEPGNCVWATPVEQANNRRSNRLITAFGRALTLAQWGREFGIEETTLSHRPNIGWSTTDALMRPLRAAWTAESRAKLSATNRARRELPTTERVS